MSGFEIILFSLVVLCVAAKLAQHFVALDALIAIFQYIIRAEVD